MWPFSGIRGQIDKQQKAGVTAIEGIRSTAGSVSTTRLDIDSVDGSAIWSSRLTDLFKYWRGKCRGRFFPSRADIDPLDIPALLPIVFLVDVTGEAADFRFRLVGSEFAQKYGAEVTGRTLRDVNRHAHSDAILEDYAMCARECVPLASRNSFINDQGIFWKYERILMPLGSDPGRPDMILGGMDINIPLSELSTLERVQRENAAMPAGRGARAR